MFALSACAVDNEIVGKDKDGELICDEGETSRPCCFAAAAARSAVVAVWVSLFDLGEGAKKLANFFTLGEEARRGISDFSLKAVVVVVDVEEGGEVFAKGLMVLRDIMGHV